MACGFVAERTRFGWSLILTSWTNFPLSRVSGIAKSCHPLSKHHTESQMHFHTSRRHHPPTTHSRKLSWVSFKMAFVWHHNRNYRMGMLQEGMELAFRIAIDHNRQTNATTTKTQHSSTNCLKWNCGVRLMIFWQKGNTTHASSGRTIVGFHMPIKLPLGWRDTTRTARK